MNQENPEQIKWIFITILAGCVGGILTAILVLFMMRTSGYSLGTLSFWLTVCVACAMPFCMDYFCGKDLFDDWSEWVLLGVSLIIVLLYAAQAAGDAATRTNMETIAVLVHGSSALVLAAKQLIRYRRSRKS